MAAKTHLYLEQGATFQEILTLKNVDGTPMNTVGYTAQSQIRKHYLSDYFYTINTTFIDNSLVLSMTAEETANVPFGRCVFDVKILDTANNVFRILEGTITISPEVTKV